MNVIVGEPAIIRMEPPQEDHLSFDQRRLLKERRKGRQERRRNTREGVYVTLSTPRERRQASDRRPYES